MSPRLPLTERCDRVNGGRPPCRKEAGNNGREEKNAGHREHHNRIVNVSARPMPENAIEKEARRDTRRQPGDDCASAYGKHA